MLGHKRIPLREGGIEIVVEELSTRMVKLEHQVTCFNRKGHHVSDSEFDKSAFGKYDVVHFHAEGPCAMLGIPKLFGKRCIATIHGIHWQRAKWDGFASKYIKFGEKVAAKYADEIIVLSEGVQK